MVTWGRAWTLSREVSPNSFVAKTLPLTPLRSRLWQDILPKVLILIYWWGGYHLRSEQKDCRSRAGTPESERLTTNDQRRSLICMRRPQQRGLIKVPRKQLQPNRQLLVILTARN